MGKRKKTKKRRRDGADGTEGARPARLGDGKCRSTGGSSAWPGYETASGSLEAAVRSLIALPIQLTAGPRCAFGKVMSYPSASHMRPRAWKT